MARKALTGALATVVRQLEHALQNGDAEKAAPKLRRAVTHLGHKGVKERIPERYHPLIDQIAATNRGETANRVA